MYFPWVGMLEQIRLADVYVRYDDVAFTTSSLTRRVQVKTAEGVRWLTVPLQSATLGTPICEVKILDSKNWRRSHRDTLRLAYKNAPFAGEMLDLVDDVFAKQFATIGDLSYASMRALAAYFGVGTSTTFEDSRELGIGSSSSDRVFAIVRFLKGTRYITGHGARNYLDHELFENNGVDVCYMDYATRAYPQLHGPFTPYVTALDVIANCGRGGAALIDSGTVTWRAFLSSGP